MNIKNLNFWISRKHSVYLQQNIIDMKKILYTIIGVTILGVLLLFWHSWEERAAREYKTKILDAIDFAYEKQIAYNWSDQQMQEYRDSLIKIWGVKPPMQCPYCYYNNLKWRRQHGH
jgi:chitinase